ncbi:hypothetical protein BGZ51_008112 [Haplosporangium sp. Z 767]|nr:hypothetical protein BGZ50_008233 [Haplosporangium sp. Z 11]KAF9178084.1 hypothetical protein BGZ51_008112 [Haplosporangium sp. Z 767]
MTEVKVAMKEGAKSLLYHSTGLMMYQGELLDPESYREAKAAEKEKQLRLFAEIEPGNPISRDMFRHIGHSQDGTFDFLLKKIDTVKRNQDIIFSNKDEIVNTAVVSAGYSLKFPNESLSYSTKVTASKGRSSAVGKERRLKNTSDVHMDVYSVHAISRQKTGWGFEELVVSADIDIFFFNSSQSDLLIKVHPENLSCDRENHADIWDCVLQNQILTLSDNVLTFNLTKLTQTPNDPLFVLDQCDRSTVSSRI